MFHPSSAPPDCKRTLPARGRSVQMPRLSAELLTAFYKLGHFVGSFTSKHSWSFQKSLCKRPLQLFGSFFQLIIPQVPRETRRLSPIQWRLINATMKIRAAFPPTLTF